MQINSSTWKRAARAHRAWGKVLANTLKLSSTKHDKRLVLLKRLEWTPDEMNDYYCPVCYQDRDQGHAPDCELAEAIDAA